MNTTTATLPDSASHTYEQVATASNEVAGLLAKRLKTETQGEVLAAVEEHGERPLDTLNAIGLLGPRTQCVHMTDLGDQDIALLAATAAHVVHCPQSNMKLASGACPTTSISVYRLSVSMRMRRTSAESSTTSTR